MREELQNKTGSNKKHKLSIYLFPLIFTTSLIYSIQTSKRGLILFICTLNDSQLHINGADWHPGETLLLATPSPLPSPTCMATARRVRKSMVGPAQNKPGYSFRDLGKSWSGRPSYSHSSSVCSCGFCSSGVRWRATQGGLNVCGGVMKQLNNVSLLAY